MALNDFLFGRNYSWVGFNGGSGIQSSFVTGLAAEGDEVIADYVSGACAGIQERIRLIPDGSQGWKWSLPSCGQGGGGFSQLPSGVVRFVRVPVVPDPDPDPDPDPEPDPVGNPLANWIFQTVDPLNTAFKNSNLGSTGAINMQDDNGNCSCGKKNWLWLVVLAAVGWYFWKGKR